MNKYTALGLGLLFLFLAFYVWATGGDFLGWMLVAPAVWFLPQAGWKFYRDFSIIAQARAELTAAAEQAPALPEPELDQAEHMLLGLVIERD